MKKILPILLLLCCSFLAQAQLNMEFVSQLDYSQTINDIWGYTAPDGTEYALVGTNTGTSIVSLADPENPVEVAFVAGITTVWRDIKTWGNFAYVTCDSCNEGLAVIDMTNLPTSVDYYFLTDLPIGNLGSCHNIYIDEFGYAYLSGCNGLNGGGIVFLDCATDPENPTYAGQGNNVYSHDVYTAGNKMFTSEIYDGVFTIYDVEDKENVVELGSQGTPFAFTHNTWLSDDGNYLFTTDEQANAPVAAYDVSDPSDIQYLDEYAPFATLGAGVIPHNVHVWQNWLIVSYYTDGCIIIDATYPDNLVEVGNFDTYIPVSTGFQGVWGAYPYLPSGLVLCTDRGNGLFVLQPTYVQAGYLEGIVTDENTGAAIANADVELLSTITFTASDALGEFKTGIATGGDYVVKVSKAGYFPEEVAVALVNGEITMIEVELTPIVPFNLTGTVIDAVSNNPIPNASVTLASSDFSYETIADANGNFEILDVFNGSYNVFAGKWGHKTNVLENQDLNMGNNAITIALEEGLEDVFAVDLGWTSTVDPVVDNPWERGVPQLATIQGFDVTPAEDISSDIGNYAYLTGNTSDAEGGFLIGATATLTSPTFDLSGYNQPMINFYEYFVNVDFNDGSPGESDFIARLSNGTDEVVVYQTSTQTDYYNFTWSEEISIDVAQFIEITDNMVFSVEVSSDGFPMVTEGGLDYWSVWEGMPVSVNNVIDPNIHIGVHPNPSTTDFRLDYDLGDWNGSSNIVVTNTLGQTLHEQAVQGAEGTLRFGAEWTSGLYFVQIKEGNRGSRVVKIVKH